MRDPAAALQAVMVAVVVIGGIGALWSAAGLGELYERIGNQLFLPPRTAARRATRRHRARPSKQLQAIEAALSRPAQTRGRRRARRRDCVR